jgi:hypothetical protein
VHKTEKSLAASTFFFAVIHFLISFTAAFFLLLLSFHLKDSGAWEHGVLQHEVSHPIMSKVAFYMAFALSFPASLLWLLGGGKIVNLLFMPVIVLQVLIMGHIEARIWRTWQKKRMLRKSPEAKPSNCSPPPERSFKPEETLPP